MRKAILDKDLGFEKLKKEIAKLKKLVIKVGVQEDAGTNSEGQKIVEYATYNEFGTRNKEGKKIIPARSFLYSTFDENDGWKENIESAFDSIVEGKTDIKTALNIVGIKARDDVIKKINDGDPNWEKLADSTVAKKKSTRPLIDTGFLKKSISYVIEGSK